MELEESEQVGAAVVEQKLVEAFFILDSLRLRNSLRNGGLESG